jgi:glycosyltransferase involved in cell wall biosynthesis
VKSDLRRKYDFPSDKYIVLHVGHINRNRNVQFLGNIQCLDYVQAIAVGSTTYPEDEDLVKELKEKGVIVLTNYFRKIEEIYQCADCYLFPVFSDGACIEVPLSVLEAMASNLPVVTTKFRGLPNLISEHNGLVYVNNKGEILSKINSVKSIPDPRTRDLVGQFSWENVVKQVLLDSILEQKSGTLF